MPAGFIPPHGGYKKLKSYQKALVIYDATRYFCARFFPKDRRQTDQMEQAARSGKQNIVEGSLASATSKQTEIHLTNVAKASLGELLEDYEDFLRVNRLPAWEKNDPQARCLTDRSRQAEDSYDRYRADIENASPEISANTIRVLIFYVIFALAKLLYRLKQQRFRKVNLRLRGTMARHPACAASPPPLPLPASFAPACPLCGAAMRCRMARTGLLAGKVYWGCFCYPTCRGTRPMEA